MLVSPVICSSAHGNTATMSWMAFPTSTGSGCWSGSNSMTRWKAPSFERSEEHTSELQSLMRISYAVFCLKKKINHKSTHNTQTKQLCDNYIYRSTIYTD